MYPPPLIEIFKRLNDAQRQVVDVGEGLACVVGNPGSGKTGSIVARMARLVCDGLPPQYILAMTFTRAAAAEMSERLTKLGITGARVGTIHSVCRQVLAEAKHHLLDHCTLDEKNGLLYELRKVIGDFRRKNKVGWWGVDFEAVTRFISACKAETYAYVAGDPFGLNMRAETQVMLIASRFAKAAGIRPAVLRDIYFEQERRREAAGKMDFDDMLQWAWLTLLVDAEERLRWRSRYSVVIIDECFHPGTLVTMADNTQISIKDVVDQQISAHVLSYDTQMDRVVKKAIIGWHKLRAVKPMLLLNVVREGGEGYTIHEIICTEDQYIWTPKKWVEAKCLRYKDKVYVDGYNGRPFEAEVLLAKEWRPQADAEKFVYDIDVEETHTFYADGIVVHNCQDSAPVQWDIPRLMTGMDSTIKAVRDLPEKWQPKVDSHPHNLMVIGDVSQCLHPTTLIETPRGYRQIDAIVEGDVVASMIGGTKSWAKVTHAGSIIKRSLVRITLDNGEELTGSSDHLIFAAMPTSGQWQYLYLNRDGHKDFEVGIAGAKQIMKKRGQTWLLNAYLVEPTKFAVKGIDGWSILNDFDALYDYPNYIHPESEGAIIKWALGSVGRDISSKGYGYSVIGGPSTVTQYFKKATDALRYLNDVRVHHYETLKTPTYAEKYLADCYSHHGTHFVEVPLAQALPGLFVLADDLDEDGQDVCSPRQIFTIEKWEEETRLHDLEIEGSTNYFANGMVVHNSIYSWRSANPSLFVDFWKRDDVKQINLPINYRSNKQICKAATELVRDKAWHLGGEIIPFNTAEVTSKIKTVHYDTVEHEASHVIRKCMEHGADEGLRSCAILARLKVSLDLAEIECIRNRIKYIKMASGSFFESKETEAILGYLRVAGGYDPNARWISYIINQPFRFIGSQLIRRAEQMASSSGLPVLDALLGPLASELTGRQKSALDELNKLLIEINSMILEAERIANPADPNATLKGPDFTRAAISKGPMAAISLMLRKTRYLDALRREDGSGRFDESKETAIEALRRIAGQFLSYRDFLGYVDQIINAVTKARKSGLRLTEGATDDALVLSTLHRIKGLQHKHVYILDVTEGTFPCSRAESLDEELRLLYVGVTRAQDTCEISWSGDDSVRSVFVRKLNTILGEPGGAMPTKAAQKPAQANKPRPAPIALPHKLPPRIWEGMPKIKLLTGTEGAKNRADCVNVAATSAVGFWRNFKPQGDLLSRRAKGELSEEEFGSLYKEQLNKISILIFVDLVGMGRSRSNVLQFVDTTNPARRHAELLVQYLIARHSEAFEIETES